ncbi:MAG: phospholipase [Acidothermaceae bacterium]
MSEQHQLGPTTEGSVVLDIGGDIGALVIMTGPALAAYEIEVSPVASDRRTHVAVRERRGQGRPQYAAVFPALRSGEYRVFDPDGKVATTVAIHGGEVSHLNWQ